MDGRFEFLTQLLETVGTDYPPPARKPASYTLEKGGGNTGITLSMVLYGITLITLIEELLAAGPGLFTPFNADTTVFEGLERRSSQILNQLIREQSETAARERGPPGEGG